VFLQLGLERREQQRVCGVCIAHVLLQRDRGQMLRGHLQRAVVVGQIQLLVHTREVGP
jgi:hypothetical protein